MRAADIDTSFSPRRAAPAFTVELDGEAVILDEARNRLHHLNLTATVVWSCFDGSGTVGDIARDLAVAFHTDTRTMTADVLALARELGAEGLLDGVDHDPAPEDETA